MKRLLIAIILLIPGISSAQWQEARIPLPIVGGNVPAGCTPVTVDLHETSEATDFLTDPPSGWSVSDTGELLSMDASGEKATISCFNSTADSGVRGVKRNGADSTAAYIIYTFGAGKTNLSLGFWYYAGSGYDTWGADNSYYLKICQVAGCASGWTKTFEEGTSAADNSQIGPWQYGASAWYWITVQHNRNATSYVSWYNANGELLLDSLEYSGFDETVIQLRFGGDGSSDTAIYLDDVVLDITDYTFPLGP